MAFYLVIPFLQLFILDLVFNIYQKKYFLSFADIPRKNNLNHVNFDKVCALFWIQSNLNFGKKNVDILKIELIVMHASFMFRKMIQWTHRLQLLQIFL